VLTLAHPSGLWVPEAARADIKAPLTIRTWIGADPRGQEIGFVLLAHPPVPSQDAAPADIHRRMRALAFAAGLRTPDQPLADLGTCLTARDGSVRLQLVRINKWLSLPTHEHWRRLLLVRAEAALVIGLIPLDVHAAAEEADRYLDRCLHTGDLMVGRVHAERVAGDATAGQKPLRDHVRTTRPV